MEIKTSLDLIDGVYHATATVYKLTEAEKEAILKFGEPTVSVGGAITRTVTRPNSGSPTTVTLVMPSDYRRLPSQFPVKRLFDTRDDVDADLKAQAWIDHVKEHMFYARSGVVLRMDAFLGTTIESQTGPSTYTMTVGTITVYTSLDADPLSGVDAGTLVGIPVELTITGSGGSGNYTYEWYMSGGPSMSPSQLTNDSQQTVTFTPDSEGVYEITGRVLNPVINAAPVTVSVESTEMPYTVTLPLTVSVAGGDSESIEAVVSHDPLFNAGTKTFLWTITSGPDTDTAQLSSTTTSTTLFTPSLDGTYVLTLTTTDSIWGNVTSTVTVNVTTP